MLITAQGMNMASLGRFRTPGRGKLSQDMTELNWGSRTFSQQLGGLLHHQWQFISANSPPVVLRECHPCLEVTRGGQ